MSQELVHNNEKGSSLLTTVIETAMKIPGVNVNRQDFLSKNLSKHCSQLEMHKAISRGTLHAGIPIEKLDRIAKDVINAETVKVTAISAATGLPGGWALPITIPADVVQFYGFVLRTAQELAYLYGWRDLTSDNHDAGTEAQLMIFIGAMSGVDYANKAVTKLFSEEAVKATANIAAIAAKNASAEAFAKKWYYPLAKLIGKKVAEKTEVTMFQKTLPKLLPVIGGVTAGALTLATFKPMAHRLQKHFSDLAHMSPGDFAAYESTVVIDVEEYMNV